MKQISLLAMTALSLALTLAAELGSSSGYSAQAACCYFAAKDKDINQPGQKAFISWNPKEQTEAFTVQPKFEGNAVDFGMVIPTPAKPKLDEMPRDFFKDLAIYTILMPLPQPIYTAMDPAFPASACAGVAGGGGAMGHMMEDRGKVRVLESGVVGSLDYKIIVSEDSQALFQWLKANKYTYGGDEATLDYYIKKKWFFTVMKIDPQQMKKASDGSYLGEVTPTRFTFTSSQCIYPLKITQISVKDKTDALFYVQAPAQMDLESDWSWMHSYRQMYLTYMLGCSADPQEQQELASCQKWLSERQRRDPHYETTKLEWAKQLFDAEMSVLEDPKKNFGQMGAGDLPPGAKVVTVDAFLAKLRQEYAKTHKTIEPSFQSSLTTMSDTYQPGKGLIVEYDPKSVGKGYIWTHFGFYPVREAPYDEVKGLTRLKGHLQKGQWLTKFRKVLRKEEMTHDLVLAEVPKEREQTYVRIMPTSPP
jgi:hypothetical protein